MLHVIAVDDEIAALNRFERIALANPGIAVRGLFQYAEDAVAYIKTYPVDVAFLDIEMPEISGLDLAERLMEINPFVKIIFITAYDQYALRAFRAHAIGYLLKPLDSDELSEKIDLLNVQFANKPAKNQKGLLQVSCFGQFSVSLSGDTGSAIRWKTSKAEELFALLIYFQGKVRSKGILIDTLWPDVDPTKVANLFRVTCTYLRSALSEIGFVDILVRELDGYKVNTSHINCDLFNFRRLTGDCPPGNLNYLEEASALCAGEYLEGKSYDWALRARTELDADFKELQFSLSNEYLARGFAGKAAGALEKVLQHDPCDEDTVALLMQIKLQKGDAASAIRIYKEYETRLEQEFGVSPSGNIQRLFAGYAD